MILHLLLIAFWASPLVIALDTTKTMTSQLHEFQLNNSAGVQSALDMLPKECTKNGKKYQPDEKFEIGNLRYKCQKYGVYTIEGCKRKDGTKMKLGESVVVDNVKHQCLGMGSSVFYKETTCGVMGQPECDKIPLPKEFEEAMKRNGGKTEAQGKTSVDGVNLPKGWSLVDGGKKQITGTNASVVTHILMFNPLQLRLKREGFKGSGVGSVVGVESMPADQIGKPLSSKGSSSSTSSSMSSSSSNSSPSSSKINGTQTVGATLHTLKSGDKHDSDLVDLNQRNDQKMAGSEKMKAGSVRGSKSNVDWKGRKTCGVMGQPECDKIPLPKGFEEAMKRNGGKTEAQGKTSVDRVNLPKGWTLVDGGKKQITGTNASVVTHILMFNPLQLRLKREGFKGSGVGSVVGVESMPADQIGKPLSSKGSSSSSSSSSMSSSSHSSPSSSKINGTQTVGATLHTLKSGDKHDSDLVDLNQRNDQKMAGSEKMKAGSVHGSKSNVDWKGRKVIVNGKTVGAGEGTFSFGNKPTV
ncbi:hypothetical protein B9Z55_012618 [Caenorhabditis nigoni]|uniref:Abnormal cell migration protein 18-like fibronectin type I domain-containing protein n=1 Tax=Caenorhabditis nigoni TaxID=1611254 RepID=A0A2G5TYL5_9PELO|nr:hypothetical protein B9Z55_012618 [Caenorhabditis nigoni]